MRVTRAAEVARVLRTIARIEGAGDAFVHLGPARVEGVTVSLATVVPAEWIQQVEARAVCQRGRSEHPAIGPRGVRREHIPALVEGHGAKGARDIAARPQYVHL